jgi:hypothetical protein
LRWESIIKVLQHFEERLVGAHGIDIVRIHIHSLIRDLWKSVRCGSDNSIIATGSTQRPEEILMFGLRRLDEVARGSDHFDLLQIVNQKTAQAMETANPSAQRGPYHAHARARAQRELFAPFSERLGELVDLHRTPDGETISCGVSLHRVELAHVDGQPVEVVVVRDAMATPCHKEWDGVGVGNFHNVLDILGRRGLDGPCAI